MRFRHLRRKITESPSTPIVENPIGRFQRRYEYPIHTSVIRGSRAVGECEVAFFYLVIPIQNEELIRDGEVLAPRHNIVKARSDKIHRFREHLADGTAQSS